MPLAAMPEQPAAASQSSTAVSKTKEELLSYHSTLKKCREAALKPGGKSKAANWWKYLEVLLVTDPVTNDATNVLLQCFLCNNQLSASNPSRIADSHLAKGGCNKVKGDMSFGTALADCVLIE